MKTYYKTKITFHVLSEEPIPEDMNLDQIWYECIEGKYSGDLDFEKKVTKLTGAQAAKELMKQGSDPEFFGIDENGNALGDDA
jgi:hypothetical protein